MDILNRPFTAKKARSLVNKRVKSELNYQRSFVLQRIEATANQGGTEISVDFSGIHLFPADYDYFEKLGYTVTRPVAPKAFVPHGSNINDIGCPVEYVGGTAGMISW